jgi:hypothetical protein
MKIKIISLLFLSFNLYGLDIANEISKVDNSIISSSVNKHLNKNSKIVDIDYSNFKNKNLGKIEKKSDIKKYIINVKVPVRKGFVYLKGKRPLENNIDNKIRVSVEVDNFHDFKLSAVLKKIIGKKRKKTIVKNLKFIKDNNLDYLLLPINGHGNYILKVTISKENKKNRYRNKSISITKSFTL